MVSGLMFRQWDNYRIGLNMSEKTNESNQNVAMDAAEVQGEQINTSVDGDNDVVAERQTPAVEQVPATEEEAPVAETTAVNRSAAAATEAPAAVDSNQAKSVASKGGGSALALLALLLCAGLAGGGWWLHQRLQTLEQAGDASLQEWRGEQQAQLQQALAQHGSQMDELATNVSLIRDQVAGQAQQNQQQAGQIQRETEALLNSRLAAVDSVIKTAALRTDGLQTRLEVMDASIDQLRQNKAPRVNLNWQAARDLLGLGRLQAERLGDFGAAVEHYEVARQLLVDNMDERSAMVVAVLDQELQRLRQVSTVDTITYLERTQSSLRAVDAWPLKPLDDSDQVGAGAAVESTEEAGWWGKTKQLVGGLVNIRRAHELDRIDEDVLRQSLRLRLQAMAGALLVADASALMAHASVANELLVGFFDREDEQVGAAASLLQELMDLDFSPTAPPLGQAEQRLQSLLTTSSEVQP